MLIGLGQLARKVLGGTTTQNLNAMSDADLVDLVRQEADAEAYAHLVERHSSRVFSVAMRFLGRRDVAEDITQEIFAMLWMRSEVWSPERGSLSAWLAIVARNKALDILRSDRPTVELDEAAAGISDGEALAAVRGDLAAVLAVVETLPLSQKTALSLTVDGGLTNEEAAAAMNLSVGALEQLLVRARRSLRLAMREDG